MPGAPISNQSAGGLFGGGAPPAQNNSMGGMFGASNNSGLGGFNGGQGAGVPAPATGNDFFNQFGATGQNNTDLGGFPTSQPQSQGFGQGGAYNPFK